jgi:hypothetical protein
MAYTDDATTSNKQTLENAQNAGSNPAAPTIF